MSEFLNPSLKKLTPYTPGEQPPNMDELIKLNTNENPFPPSQKVFETLTKDAVNRLRLYPDPTLSSLKNSIAKSLKTAPETVFCTNGSDEALALIFHGFCAKGAVFPLVTYGFYKVFCQMFDVPYTEIPLTKNYEIDINDYAEYDQTVVIANPNAPTGMYLKPATIRSLLDQNPNRAVVVDEAYIDFGGESALPLIREYKNLFIVRTFSKSRNLAGARIGFVIADSGIIQDLETLRCSFHPYNINSLSMAIGAASVSDKPYFDECCKKIIENREFLREELSKLGFYSLDSMANFLFVKPVSGISGKEYLDWLRQDKILVRWFDRGEIRDFVRITIGTREQMEAVITSSKRLLKTKG